MIKIEDLQNINIIRSIIDKNPSNIQSSFNVAMSRKVIEAIEAKKAEVGQNLFRENADSLYEAKSYDMKGPYELTKVGFDTNGNWSYFINKNGKKYKVQHLSMKNGGGLRKLTKDDLKNWKASDHTEMINAIIDHIEHTRA